MSELKNLGVRLNTIVNEFQALDNTIFENNAEDVAVIIILGSVNQMGSAFIAGGPDVIENTILLAAAEDDYFGDVLIRLALRIMAERVKKGKIKQISVADLKEMLICNCDKCVRNRELIKAN